MKVLGVSVRSTALPLQSQAPSVNFYMQKLTPAISNASAHSLARGAAGARCLAPLVDVDVAVEAAVLAPGTGGIVMDNDVVRVAVERELVAPALAV